jgi:hypothetical protein
MAMEARKGLKKENLSAIAAADIRLSCMNKHNAGINTRLR